MFFISRIRKSGFSILKELSEKSIFNMERYINTLLVTL